MRSRLLLVALFLFLAPAAVARPQGTPFPTAFPQTQKLRVTSAAVPAGGFLAGTDDCAAAHRAVPAGDQLGVPFTTGTDGAQGQSEALCDFFGMDGIAKDVWFDWTATQTGSATLRTCSGTLVDTKVAIWPAAAGCPADGTALACNDDACGLQTTVSWSVLGGATYTIQLGTFPGAAGGSGTFDIVQSAGNPCGIYDDGGSENALGLNGGGELAWMHAYSCFGAIDTVSTAYGSPAAVSVPNGTHSWLCVYEDADCDGNPGSGPASLLVSLNSAVMNSGLDVLTPYPLPALATIPSGCSFVLASTDVAIGEFAAPLDQTSPTPRSWIVANVGAPSSLDIVDLTQNSTGPFQMHALGFQTSFLLRAQGTAVDNVTSLCYGDGSATPCPCGNSANVGEGCANSTGAGALLSASGFASVSQDSFSLQATQIPNQPGIFFQGDVPIASPPVFGAGLRCCGMNLVRWITVQPTAGCASTGPTPGCGTHIGGPGGSITALAGLSAGDTRCYQYWHRDPSGSPCPGTDFNLSPAVAVSWLP